MLGESLLGQRLGDFSAAVGAEIEAQHDISRSDASVDAFHQKRLHKFVGHPAIVMCLHTFNGRSVGRIALSEEGLVGAGNTFPALVSIHGEIPAVD